MRSRRSADCLTEDLIHHIISFLTSPSDLSTASLLNKQWYTIHATTRRSITVRYCFAVSPTRLTRRFPKLKSITLLGRPEPQYTNFIHSPTDGYSDRWIECLASSYAGGLEELKLKRFVLSPRLLSLIAQSFPNLRSLAFVDCIGIFNSGFGSILSNCRLLQVLEVNGCAGMSQYGQWSSAVFDSCQSLVSLTLVNIYDGLLDTTVLEKLVSRCRNLKCLKIDEPLRPDVFTRILEAAPQLVELGFGSPFPPGDNDIHTKFSNAVISCTSVQSLSGSWHTSNLLSLKPLCSKLLFLDLTKLNSKPRGNISGFIKECHNLQRLWVLISVGDSMLRSVGRACKKLQELKVIAQTFGYSTGTVSVTDAGLAAIARGSHMLQSVTYTCRCMSNDALVTLAQQNPDIRSFKMIIQQKQARDVKTYSSFDEGFGATLQHCKNLYKLSIQNAYVTDHVFFLAGMFAAQLKKLSVPLAGESNGGIFYALSLCPNLRQLVIRGTSMDIKDAAPIGDATLLAAAEKFENLQFVWVGSSQVTVKGSKTLKETYTALSVDIMDRFGETEDLVLDKVVQNLLIYHRLDEA